MNRENWNDIDPQMIDQIFRGLALTWVPAGSDFHRIQRGPHCRKALLDLSGFAFAVETLDALVLVINFDADGVTYFACYHPNGRCLYASDDIDSLSYYIQESIQLGHQWESTLWRSRNGSQEVALEEYERSRAKDNPRQPMPPDYKPPTPRRSTRRYIEGRIVTVWDDEHAGD